MKIIRHKTSLIFFIPMLAEFTAQISVGKKDEKI